MADKKSDDSDIKKMSFEEALQELEALVETLEDGSGDLDKAIVAYERGTLLKKHCETKPKEAKTRIDKITVGPDGTVDAEPADSE